MDNSERLFHVFKEEDPVRIKWAKNVCDRDWKKYFGEVQEKYLNPKTRYIDNLVIDFSSCEFADPTPLMSFCLSAAYFAINGGNLHVKLAKLDHKSHNKRCFLKFLAREGFLRILLVDINELSKKYKSGGCIECYAGITEITIAHIAEIEKIKDRLDYERSRVFPVKIIDFEPIHGRDFNTKKHLTRLKLMDELTDYIVGSYVYSFIQSEVKLHYQSKLLYQLKITCREAIHNVVEHAYESTGIKIGLACVFIRYRLGKIGASENETKYINRGIEREGNDDEKCVPKLDNHILESLSGFFEVFVADLGRGITASDVTLTQKGALNGVMYDILYSGYSRKKTRPTRFGGLMLVSRLSGVPGRDYIRICDAGQWWGSGLPLTERGDISQAIEKTSSGRASIQKNTVVRGCYLTFRYGWNDQKVAIEQFGWDAIDSSLITRNPFRKAFLPMKAPPYLVRDNRIEGQEFCNLSQSGNISELAIYLPPSGLMKNVIQKEVVRFCKETQSKKLVIGDVDPIEALAYRFAIDSSAYLKARISIVDRIYVVSTTFQCMIFERKHGGAFVKIKEHNRSEVAQDLGFYLEAIRRVDSERIWNNISNEEDISSILLTGKVDWGEGKLLNEYLDFSLVFSNNISRELLIRSIDRYRGYNGIIEGRLGSTDYLAETLVSEFNRKASLEEDSKPMVLLGSVQVTGSTTRRMLPEESDNVIYCFSHPDSTEQWDSLFLWRKHIERENDINSKYRRIGSTPFIAQGGWKYYKLPRFDTDGQHIYAQSPADLYDSLQDISRPIAKLGHWKYGANHDFLTLNILSAFDSRSEQIGFFANFELASYVMLNFFTLFKVTKKSLNKDGRDIFDRTREMKDKYNGLYLQRPKPSYEPLMIYPSHMVTNNIVSFFLGLFNDVNERRRIRKYLIPLTSIKRTREVSALQLSGHAHEALVKTIYDINSNNKKAWCIFFDDASISARTQLEVEAIAKGAGVEEFKVFILFDRRRLPEAIDVCESDVVAYSRFDLPVMGKSGACQLCNALGMAEHLPIRFLERVISKRIEQWLVDWRARETTTEWGGHGLRSIPLTLKNPIKKYGLHSIKIEDEGGGVIYEEGYDEITITNSLGLVAWIAELQTITGRDDLALTVVDGETISPEICIQVLSSQIILFGNELDELVISNICRKLIEASAKLKIESSHTSLVSLILQTVSKRALFSAMKGWLDTRSTLKFFSLNIDLQILLSFVIMKGFSHNLRQDVITSARMLSKPQGKYEYLWRFHYEVTDARGKSHISPLNRVCNIPSRYFESKQEFHLTLSFLKHLFRLGILEQLSLDVMTNRNLMQSASRDIVMIEEISAQLDGIGNREGSRDVVRMLGAKVIDLLDNLNDMHKLLFVDMDGEIAEDQWMPGFGLCLIEKFMKNQSLFGSKYAELVNTLKCEPIIQLSGLAKDEYSIYKTWKLENDFEKVFLLFDANAVMVLNEVLGNLKHCEGRMIKNPFSMSNSLSVKAHAWIMIKPDMQSGFVEVWFANGKGPISLSRLKSTDNFKHSLNKVKASGGDWFLDDCDDQEFRVMIKLPLAHTLEGFGYE